MSTHCEENKLDLGMQVKRRGRYKIGEIVEMSGPGLRDVTVRWGDPFSDRVGKTSIVPFQELGEVLEVSGSIEFRGRSRVQVRYCDGVKIMEEGPKQRRPRRKRRI